MKVRTLNVEFSPPAHRSHITIGSDLLSNSGEWAYKALGPDVRKVAVVSNPTVFALYGDQFERSLRSAGFAVSRFLMKDGERYKTLRTAEDALRSFTQSGLSRTDAVAGLGGGVVGDLSGFVASTYLRGVGLLQIPTTLLAMVDASVGGKTGVNTSFGKNLIGTFHQPAGVLADVEVLKTLPLREVVAGRFEIVKHAVLAGKKLLRSTADFFDASGTVEGEDLARLADLIYDNVRFKASIVEKDGFESPENTGRTSRKVLNFGHTFAHALEKVTDYKRFRHGEAVGWGILFAAELSKSLALCKEKDIRLLYDVVHRAGPLPALAGIDGNRLLEASGFDKKQTPGGLQMVLLEGIGKPKIVTGIPRPTLKRVLHKFLQDRA